jgi:hypothetical protein
VQATVVTITTTRQPGARSYTHTIVIAGNRARSSDELDRWRLFDFGRGEVTFVDDIARTYRTVPSRGLLADRRAADNEPLPDAFPQAQIRSTDATRVVQGVTTRESVVTLGAYERHLWIGSHPLIPQDLFATMEATRPATTPMDGAMRAVDDELLAVRGFPFAEHAELPYGNQKLILDRTVTSIQRRNVPAAWLNVGPGYRDLTPHPSHATAH